MKIARTHDMAVVKAILEHPKIAAHIREDDVAKSDPIDHEGFYWMLIDDGEPAGVFLLHARGSHCFEMHTCLLPRIWGAGAAHAAKLLLAWLSAETDCRKLVTSIPAYNRAAMRFAKAGGMTQEGVNRASFFRDGAMVDQIEFGITKQEWETCQQQSLSQQQ